MSSNGTKDMGASHSYRYVSVSVSTGYTNGWSSETELWKNSSPTSSNGKYTISLNYSVANYRYIKVCWRYSTATSSPGTNTSYIITERSKFQTSTQTTTGHMQIAIGAWIGSAWCRRAIFYVSNTSVEISACVDGNNSSRSTYCIPTYIYGLN